MAIHQVTLVEIGEGLTETGRAALARQIECALAVGASDDGLFDVEVEAGSREEALAKVRDAIAALGIDERLTFPSTTGTEYTAPGRHAPPPDERPNPVEPPHLQRGSPHEDVPAPYDPPPPQVP